MKDDDKDAVIIPFPTRHKGAESQKIIPEKISNAFKIALPEEGAYNLIIALSAISMATEYKGEFDKDCKQNLETECFPCSENCGCYVHMLSSMALEVVFDGPRKIEAKDALYHEYSLLRHKGPQNKKDS